MPKRKIRRSSKNSLSVKISRFKSRFSRLEVEHIAIAWIVLAFAFAFLLERNVASVTFAFVFLATAVVLFCGFIMHELMHKFTAQKYRYFAEFRIWPAGIMFALLTAYFGFIFAAPGATYFEPDQREYILDPKGFTKRYGEISLAGPRINILFGLLFLTLFYVTLLLTHGVVGNLFTSFVFLVTGLGAFINFYLCAFNMLPINPLDGYKVFRWDKRIWAAFFLSSVAVSAMMILGIIPVLQAL